MLIASRIPHHFISIASCYGIPSLVKDDYVTLSASSCTPGNAPPWLARVPRRAIDALRISRLTDRIASTLGHTASTPSGQLPVASTAPLFSVFTAELGELERNIGQMAGEADMLTMQRVHLCRIRLCAFMLQSGCAGEDHGDGSGQRALSTTDCYVSCIRLIETACTAPRAEVARWPMSVSFGYPAACVRRAISLSPFIIYRPICIRGDTLAYESKPMLNGYIDLPD